MNTIQIPKHVIEFNKQAFDSAIDAMIAIQDQSAKYAASFAEKATWLPDEGKKALSEWMKSYKKGFESLKAATDENYKKVAEYLSMAENMNLSKNSKNDSKSSH